MSGDESVAAWIADKLKGDTQFQAVDPLGLGFLNVVGKDGHQFLAAAIGVKSVVEVRHVIPVFTVEGTRPEFIVNVPSKAIWTSSAIDYVHNAPAAFGTLGDLRRASRENVVSSYRNKEFNFFERIFRQHSAVVGVTRLYDRLYSLQRRGGLPDISVVLLEAYDVSAEHVRNARELYGSFDLGLKTTNYGSITSAATEAARSMGAEVFNLRDFMGRLGRP